MKIKAVYKYRYSQTERPVLIIGFDSNYNVICMTCSGHLIYADRSEVRIIDDDYLKELQNG